MAGIADSPGQAAGLLDTLRSLEHGPWWPPLDELIDAARRFYAGGLAETPPAGLVAGHVRPGPLAGALAVCGGAIWGGTSMADADDVRRLALALPHVEEIDSDGFDFRVGGKGFVWSYPERTPGKPRLIRTDIAVLYVGDEARNRRLSSASPGSSSPRPAMTGGR